MDLQNHSQNNQQSNTNSNSGSLLRFRSAPSALPNDSLDERLYTRFMITTTSSGINEPDSVHFHDFEDKSAVAVTGDLGMNRRNELLPQYLRRSSGMDSVNGSYRGAGLMGSVNNLARQNSSPAGFVSQLDAQSGYDTTGGARNFGVENHREVSSSVSRLGSLFRISEIDGDESNGTNSSNNVKLDDQDTRFFGPAFPFTSWTNSVQFTEDGDGDWDEEKFLTTTPTQSGDQSNRGRVLSHHLSLPKTSELATMERLMQFQDSVPCKVRAKRGCATHPRSIAERVRRTRISERMRKLQELVPNMDKQTNTSDMLDLAVDYIKDLQKQFKMLSDIKAKCKCLHVQRSTPTRAI